MWEVDPETKSKLLTLQKQPPNSICADCSSPSPQWASPKFGTFICLDCAGVHRGLGVHISFVRSVMMDSFKVSEVRRMEEGGNKAWRTFYEEHKDGGNGKTVEWDSVVASRYDSSVGEEYKERLAANVEGREYVPPVKKEIRKPTTAAATSLSNTPSRTASPATTQKVKNEAYFAKMGAENANRSEDLAPSQGGKYAGFGSSYVPESQQQRQEGIPSADEFQKDPVAALTKGFGWFSATVSKQAKSVNEGWIQPTAQKLAESDFAAQAKQTATVVANNVSKGAQGAASTVGQGFNRFVEGEDKGHAGTRGVEPEKKDFWDSFGGSATSSAGGQKKSSTIGTAAMKPAATTSNDQGGEQKEDWGKDDW